MLLSSKKKKNASVAQQEANHFVQSALDALSAHVAILDDSGEIIGVNRAWRTFAEANGFKQSNYGIGTNYLRVCDNSTQRNSEDAPQVASGIRAVMKGKAQEFQLEYPCHSPTEKRWFVVRISRFEWYNDVRLIVAHQNVSDLKHAQIELEESKRRIQAILDNINNGILTLTPDGIIEIANPAAARIFGYTMEELVGLHLNSIVDEPFADKKSLRSLNGEHGHEIIGCRKDGTAFPMYFALNELRLNGGSLYTCIVQDLTYRKRMEAEIIEREKVQVALEKERELRVLKDRFLSMMGHELNTPLTSISLSYDMLKKYGDISTEEENTQALDNIQQQVQHLRTMVEDVMTFSRSEGNGFELSLQRTDLITYCRDVVEEFQFGYHKTHRIEFECEERDIRADIDRRLLRRTFTNLLSNAIKYSPEGGSVVFRLGIDAAGEQAIVEVSDSGIGIPPEDQPRLFEPFHRASNVDQLPGTGLGLPIAKQAVELHDGSIHFETEMGHGTTFIITLPLRHSYDNSNGDRSRLIQ